MKAAAPRLSEATRALWARHAAQVPLYRRNGPAGVVHLGLGGFHRAHQALVFDRLLSQGDARWGVMGVGMTRPDLVKTLAEQNGLYALQVHSAQGSHWQVPGALMGFGVASHRPQEVIDHMAAPTTRWITLTVTEKGYGPALYELLLTALAQRQAAGRAGVTVASCDNLPSNGQRLRRALQQQAETSGRRGLWRWMDRHCAFPNSLVDRIVPATAPDTVARCAQDLGVYDPTALATEAFGEWVLEDQFADPSDAQVLAAWSVRITADVSVYEQAKLGMLNGSHTALALIGVVAGWPTVGEAMAQPAVRQFVHRLMTEEVAPQLARSDWAFYRDELIQRFDNPHLRHATAQIAKDTTQKIGPRWWPSLRARRSAGLPVPLLAFAAAVFVRWCQGVNEAGQAYRLDDPLGHQLSDLAARHNDAQALTAALLGLESVWGPLAHDPAFHHEVGTQFQAIREIGVLPALQQRLRRTP